MFDARGIPARPTTTVNAKVGLVAGCSYYAPPQEKLSCHVFTWLSRRRGGIPLALGRIYSPEAVCTRTPLLGVADGGVCTSVKIHHFQVWPVKVGRKRHDIWMFRDSGWYAVIRQRLHGHTHGHWAMTPRAASEKLQVECRGVMGACVACFMSYPIQSKSECDADMLIGRS